MEGSREWSLTPSHKDTVSNKGKTPVINSKGLTEERNRDNEKGTKGTKTKVNNSTKDKEEEDKN